MEGEAEVWPLCLVFNNLAATCWSYWMLLFNVNFDLEKKMSNQVKKWLISLNNSRVGRRWKRNIVSVVHFGETKFSYIWKQNFDRYFSNARLVKMILDSTYVSNILLE